MRNQRFEEKKKLKGIKEEEAKKIENRTLYIWEQVSIKSEKEGCGQGISELAEKKGKEMIGGGW